MFIEVPSKTFLMGEYCVLKGGPSLLLSTSPCFRVGLTAGLAEVSAVHPQSPAGVYLAAMAAGDTEKAVNWKLNICFQDPYLGKGGLGGSGAQFLGALVLTQKINKTPMSPVEALQALDLFRKCSNPTNTLFSASGADVVSQSMGRVCFFHGREIANAAWPANGIGFAIFRTQTKIPTHEHLSNLADFDAQTLSKIVLNVWANFLKPEVLIRGVKAYRDELIRLGLSSEASVEFCGRLERGPGALAAKGCGALGADTVLVLYDVKSEFLTWAKVQGCELIATEKNLCEGLRIQEQSTFEKNIQEKMCNQN